MNAYEHIMAQVKEIEGMKEYKALVRQLVVAARNKKAYRIEDLRLPCIAMVAAAGSGVTLHLHLLADLIEVLQLIPFNGDRNCVEWMASENPVSSLQDTLRKAAGFYGIFRGIVGVNMTHMIDHSDEKKLRDSLQQILLYAQTHRLLQEFVFIIPMDAKEEVKRLLLEDIRKSLPLHVIQMPFPDDDGVLDYISLKLKERGFSVGEDAESELREITEIIREDEEFKGYQTLLNTVDEIIWKKTSCMEGNATEVSSNDIGSLRLELETRIRKKNKNVRSIGFTGGKL